MASLEARIAKHIIRLQKTKARQIAEQQRHAYYTAPGPSLRLLHGQIAETRTFDRGDNKRDQTLVEKEACQRESCTRIKDAPDAYGRSLEQEDVYMTPEEARVYGEMFGEEGNRTRQEELRRQDEQSQYEELRRKEEEEVRRQQEELRRQEEEVAQRRYEEEMRYDELRRQEEEEIQRQYNELRMRQDEETQRQQEELRRRQQEEAQRQQEELRMRQDEDAQRQQEELRKLKDAQRQQDSRAHRFHPYYMRARDEKRTQHLDIVNQYELWWEKLRNSSNNRFLSFSDIPWPTKFTPSNPPDITKEAVKSFLIPFGLMSNSKECLKKEMLRWHPDKFSATVLSKVYEDQVRQVEQAMNYVSGILSDLMKEGRLSKV